MPLVGLCDMPPTVEQDRWREAEHICRSLPPRPLTRRDSEVLQADPDYDVYWVRGHYDRTGKKAVTQLAVRFHHSHVLALNYSANIGNWEAIATGSWPADIQTISGDLTRTASPTADWHTPLTNVLE